MFIDEEICPCHKILNDLFQKYAVLKKYWSIFRHNNVFGEFHIADGQRPTYISSTFKYTSLHPLPLTLVQVPATV